MRDTAKVIRQFKQKESVTDELFSIGQICQASGFSRSMILKLENDGYLTPRKINQETGYRYYDGFNIYQLQQYQYLRTIGLSRKEILGYRSGDMEPQALLKQLKTRLELLQRGVDEFSLRLAKENNFTFSVLELPETTCYCRSTDCVYPSEVAVFTYNITYEVIRLGYSYYHDEPLFSLRSDTQTNPIGNPDKPYHTTICIPLDPASIKKQPDDHIQRIPSCKALSILYYGTHEDTDAINKAHRLLWEEMDRRGLEAVGPMRALGIVAPYVGIEIEPKDYVFRFAIPIEEV